MYTKLRTECSPEELNKFDQLARCNTKRQTIYLDRVKLIAFAFEGDELISTRCIKQPYESYRIELFKHAQMDTYYRCYPYESGYSYTVPHFRRNGLSTMLLKKLLAFRGFSQHKIFATTLMHNTPIIKVMIKVGGKPIGRPFESQNGMVMVWKLR
jgi:RimJ/RimL family protein N-acetyltransferase